MKMSVNFVIANIRKNLEVLSLMELDAASEVRINKMVKLLDQIERESDANE